MPLISTLPYVLGSVALLFATWDAAYASSSGVTLSQNNLDAAIPGSKNIRDTTVISGGAHYCEIKVVTWSGRYGPIIGICDDAGPVGYGVPNSYGYWTYGQAVINTSPNVAYGASINGGDVVGMLYNGDAGTIEFFVNGVSQGIMASNIASKSYRIFASSAGSAYDCEVLANFGQSPWLYPQNAGTASPIA